MRERIGKQHLVVAGKLFLAVQHRLGLLQDFKHYEQMPLVIHYLLHADLEDFIGFLGHHFVLHFLKSKRDPVEGLGGGFLLFGLHSCANSLLRLLFNKANMVKVRAKGLIASREMGNNFEERLVSTAVVLVEDLAIEWRGLAMLAEFETLVKYLVAPHDVEPGFLI